MFETCPLADHATVQLTDYEKSVRQIVIKGLGHEEPTFLLTNQLTRSAGNLIERYARRMIIENSIQDGVDFFHMDALSSAVPMKVDCDLQLTLMASSLYRLFGNEIGQGYEHAKSRTLFRDFVDAHASVEPPAGCGLRTKTGEDYSSTAHCTQFCAQFTSVRRPPGPCNGGSARDP